jgi:hypothetical protein
MIYIGVLRKDLQGGGQTGIITYLLKKQRSLYKLCKASKKNTWPEKGLPPLAPKNVINIKMYQVRPSTIYNKPFLVLVLSFPGHSRYIKTFKQSGVRRSSKT